MLSDTGIPFDEMTEDMVIEIGICNDNSIIFNKYSEIFKIEFFNDNKLQKITFLTIERIKNNPIKEYLLIGRTNETSSLVAIEINTLFFLEKILHKGDMITPISVKNYPYPKFLNLFQVNKLQNNYFNIELNDNDDYKLIANIEDNQGVTLKEYLKQENVSIKTKLTLLFSISNFIAILQLNYLSHRNLNVENVIIIKKATGISFKVINFFNSAIYKVDPNIQINIPLHEDNKVYLPKINCCPDYIYEGADFDPSKFDVWGIGVIFYNMFSYEILESTSVEDYKKNLTKFISETPDDYIIQQVGKEVSEIMKSCIDQDAKIRPNIEMIENILEKKIKNL